MLKLSPVTSALEQKRLEAVRRYDILDTPPDGAFDRVTALAADYFHVPIAIVSVVDEDRIWFKSHHGLEVTEIDREPGLCASAILQHDPWIVENAAVDPRTLANPLVASDFGLRFYAGVPLTTSEGYNLGTLCIIDREPREMDERGVERLRDMARIVMDELELRLAARNAIAREQRLRRESEAATMSLQRSLLPASLPQIPGADIAALYEPASRLELGGDFYDCFAVAEERWSLMIGDVAGKGPEAAAVTSMARHAARAASLSGIGPAGVLETVNRVLLAAGEENSHRLVTLTFIELRRSGSGFELEISRGGHPPALIARHEDVVEGLVAPDPPLGCFAGTTYRSANARIGSGEVLLLYTDGLSDARIDGGFLGTRAIRDLLAEQRHRDAEQIVESLRTLARGGEIRDDVAAFVFKVTDRAALADRGGGGALPPHP